MIDNYTELFTVSIVLDLRTEYPDWGGRKLARVMRNRGYCQIPSPSTITEILRRHGVMDNAALDAALQTQQDEGGRLGDILLVEKLISACRQAGVKRLVQVSALNAGKGDSYYLITKGQAEELIRSACDLQSTIVQPSVIFGRSDDFFNRFAALLKLIPAFPLACPDAKMQPVWVGDVAAAITAALDDSESVGKTLVMVGPEEFTLKELVERTAVMAGLKRRVIGLPDALSRMQATLMGFVPGKPFSSDNYRSLQIDNTSTENSLWRFGIRPRSIGSLASECLGHSVHQQQLDRCRAQTTGR